MKTRLKCLVVTIASLFIITACGSGGGSDITDSIPEVPPVVINPDGEGNLPQARDMEELIREPNEVEAPDTENLNVGFSYPTYTLPFQLQGCDGGSLVIFRFSDELPNVETSCLEIVLLANDHYTGTRLELLTATQIEVIRNAALERGGYLAGEYTLEQSQMHFSTCPDRPGVCSKPLVGGRIQIDGLASISGFTLVAQPVGQTRSLVVIKVNFKNPVYPEVF